MSEEAWGHEEVEKMDDVTIKKLNALCVQAQMFKERKDKLKEELKGVEEKFTQYSNEVLKYLEHFKMQRHSGEFGMVYQTRRFKVNNPQGDNKFKYHQYLKDRGEFEGAVTINNNSLNRMIRTHIEETTGKDITSSELTTAEIKDALPPGIELPNFHTSLRIKK